MIPTKNAKNKNLTNIKQSTTALLLKKKNKTFKKIKDTNLKTYL